MVYVYQKQHQHQQRCRDRSGYNDDEGQYEQHRVIGAGCMLLVCRENELGCFFFVVTQVKNVAWSSWPQYNSPSQIGTFTIVYRTTHNLVVACMVT